MLLGSLPMLVLACAGASQTAAYGTTSVTSALVLQDEELAAVHLAQGEGAEEKAQLAEARAASPSVRRFADHMMRDHNAANDALSDAMDRIGLVAKENAVSQRIEEEERVALDSLAATPEGAAFDRAYMIDQVKAVERALDLLDSKLLPGARRPELRAALAEARAAAEAHLREATAIVRALGR
jgi:putative membrane protein